MARDPDTTRAIIKARPKAKARPKKKNPMVGVSGHATARVGATATANVPDIGPGPAPRRSPGNRSEPASTPPPRRIIPPVTVKAPPKAPSTAPSRVGALITANAKLLKKDPAERQRGRGVLAREATKLSELPKGPTRVKEHGKEVVFKSGAEQLAHEQRSKELKHLRDDIQHEQSAANQKATGNTLPSLKDARITLAANKRDRDAIVKTEHARMIERDKRDIENVGVPVRHEGSGPGPRPELVREGRERAKKKARLRLTPVSKETVDSLEKFGDKDRAEALLLQMGRNGTSSVSAHEADVVRKATHDGREAAKLKKKKGRLSSVLGNAVDQVKDAANFVPVVQEGAHVAAELAGTTIVPTVYRTAIRAAQGKAPGLPKTTHTKAMAKGIIDTDPIAQTVLHGPAEGARTAARYPLSAVGYVAPFLKGGVATTRLLRAKGNRAVAAENLRKVRARPAKVVLKEAREPLKGKAARQRLADDLKRERDRGAAIRDNQRPRTKTHIKVKTTTIKRGETVDGTTVKAIQRHNRRIDRLEYEASKEFGGETRRGRPAHAGKYTPDPKDIRTKPFFHGSGAKGLHADALDSKLTDPGGLFGQGIYMTDDPVLARSYANHRSTGRHDRRGGVVYKAQLNLKKPMDMEKPANNDLRRALAKAVALAETHVQGTHLENQHAPAWGRHLAEIRGQLTTAPGRAGDVTNHVLRSLEEAVQLGAIPESVAREASTLMSHELRRSGYDALTHVGGRVTNNRAHHVVIVLDPMDHAGAHPIRRQMDHFKATTDKQDIAPRGEHVAVPEDTSYSLHVDHHETRVEPYAEVPRALPARVTGPERQYSSRVTVRAAQKAAEKVQATRGIDPVAVTGKRATRLEKRAELSSQAMTRKAHIDAENAIRDGRSVEAFDDTLASKRISKVEAKAGPDVHTLVRELYGHLDGSAESIASRIKVLRRQTSKPDLLFRQQYEAFAKELRESGERDTQSIVDRATSAALDEVKAAENSLRVLEDVASGKMDSGKVATANRIASARLKFGDKLDGDLMASGKLDPEAADLRLRTQYGVAHDLIKRASSAPKGESRVNRTWTEKEVKDRWEQEARAEYEAEVGEAPAGWDPGPVPNEFRAALTNPKLTAKDAVQGDWVDTRTGVPLTKQQILRIPRARGYMNYGRNISRHDPVVGEQPLGKGFTGIGVHGANFEVGEMQSRRLGKVHQDVMSRRVMDQSYGGPHGAVNIDDASALADQLGRETGHDWMPLPAGSIGSGEVKTLGGFEQVDGLKAGEQGYVVAPKAIGDMWTEQHKQGGRLSAASSMITRGFYRGVLPLSPSWHASNALDSSMRAAVAGVKPGDRGIAQALAEEAMKLDPERADALMKGQVGHAGSRRERTTMDIRDVFNSGKHPNGTVKSGRLTNIGNRLYRISQPWRGARLKKEFDHLVDTSFNAATKIENAFIEGAQGVAARKLAKQWQIDVNDHRALAQRMLNDPAAEARFHNMTLGIMGDYLRESAKEARWRGTAMPFLPWLKASFKWTFHELPSNHPMKLAAFGMLMAATEEQRRTIGMSDYISKQEAEAIGAPKLVDGFLNGAADALGGYYYPLNTAFSPAQAMKMLLDPIDAVGRHVLPQVSGVVAKALGHSGSEGGYEVNRLVDALFGTHLHDKNGTDPVGALSRLGFTYVPGSAPVAGRLGLTKEIPGGLGPIQTGDYGNQTAGRPKNFIMDLVGLGAQSATTAPQKTGAKGLQQLTTVGQSDKPTFDPATGELMKTSGNVLVDNINGGFKAGTVTKGDEAAWQRLSPEERSKQTLLRAEADLHDRKPRIDDVLGTGFYEDPKHPGDVTYAKDGQGGGGKPKVVAAKPKGIDPANDYFAADKMLFNAVDGKTLGGPKQGDVEGAQRGAKEGVTPTKTVFKVHGKPVKLEDASLAELKNIGGQLSRAFKAGNLTTAQRIQLQRDIKRVTAASRHPGRELAAPDDGMTFTAHGGNTGLFLASGTDYKTGDEQELAGRLDRLGKELGLKLTGLSGHRTPEHSVAVGGFPNDPHTKGAASDTPGIEGVSEATLNKYGLTRPFGGAKEADHIQLLHPGAGQPLAAASPTGAPASKSARTLVTSGGGPARDALRVEARKAAIHEGIDPDAFERQLQQESGFDGSVTSPKGAAGIGQFMPGTARSLGLNPRDDHASIKAAAKLMAQQIKQYGGLENALRAYNAGPGAIEASKGYKETNDYVRIIMGGSGAPARVVSSNGGGGNVVNGHSLSVPPPGEAGAPSSSTSNGAEVPGVTVPDAQLLTDPADIQARQDLLTQMLAMLQGGTVAADGTITRPAGKVKRSRGVTAPRSPISGDTKKAKARIRA